MTRGIVLCAAAVTLLVACGPVPADTAAAPQAGSTPVTAPVAQLQVEVVAVYPHDARAFTQGLDWHDGALYESTGLLGRSSLRQVDVTTGRLVRHVDVPRPFFAEGIAIAGDRLIQLTWENHAALLYELSTFKTIGQFAYPTEGWGLCFDGTRLIMSDGSDRLYYRDPQTFDARGQVTVTQNGRPLSHLNELECVGAVVYANVWQTDSIVRIDAVSGQVTAVISAGGLLTAAEREKTDVMNGIAYDPQTKTFLLTGKLWPKLFRVRFVPEGPPAAQ